MKLSEYKGGAMKALRDLRKTTEPYGILADFRKGKVWVSTGKQFPKDATLLYYGEDKNVTFMNIMAWYRRALALHANS